MKSKNKLLASKLYARYGISSLSTKLLLPVAALMVITLIISIIAFNINTEYTQTRLLGQQLNNDADQLKQSLNQRMANLASAAFVLARDPTTMKTINQDDDAALLQLNDRAVIVRDGFDLDMVQIYDQNGEIRVNLLLSDLFDLTDTIRENSIEVPHFHLSDGKLLVLNQMILQDHGGTVVVGIDLENELERLLRQFRLASDVTISANSIEAGNSELVCGMDTGFIDDAYIQQYEFQLADQQVCMLLSRPAEQVQQTLRSGMYIMVINALITIALLSALIIAITSAIVKPIRNLADAAQAVALGDMNRHVTAGEVSSILGIGVDDELSLQAQAFNRMVTEISALYNSLEERVNNRTLELSVTAGVAKAVAGSGLNLQAMCRAVSLAIQRQFGFDVTGILRYDEAQNTVSLIAGAQSTQFDEVPDGLILTVGDKTWLHNVIQTHQARISQVIALEPVQYRIPNLPALGSYAAVPICTTDRLYGLVYVQHHLDNFMTSDITATLHTLADQIAIGFENVELYTVAEQARDAAEAANTSKSQFLARMSHELRTPMNAILGFTQVLQRSETIPEHNQEHLKIIYRSGEHLLALINDVLDMSKIEAGQSTLTMTNFDLHEQLAELELMFRLRAQEAGLSLNLEIASGVPEYIRTDQSKLRQVLINLLGNAIKFTESGSVSVRAKPIDQMNVTSSPQGSVTTQCVRFEVSDTGPGIASEDLDRIFEAFVQTEVGSLRPEGTGLGLPISREFVHLLGGELSVQSAPGQGSTFSFQLELETVTGISGPLPNSKRIVGVQSEYPLKILVADDNQTNCLLITEIMRSIGLESRQVSNGQQAVRTVHTWLPDLIWMDMRMPVLSGELAAQQIRQSFQEKGLTSPVIIAITASVLNKHEPELQWFDDVIWEPFHDYKLYNAMHEHLGIEFITEEWPEDSTDVYDDHEDIIFEEARQLSIETRSNLESAITRLDMQDISNNINFITSQHPALGRYLQNLEVSFDYDTILQLIRHTDTDRTT